MMVGPLGYVVVQFSGSRFIGEILPALSEVQERGCVRLVDLIFINKDETGELTLLEISDLGEEDALAYQPLLDGFHALFTAEDVATAAAGLPENSSAVMAVFEHLWAQGLQQAVHAAGGEMLDSGYVHPQTQAEIISEVITAMIRMEVEDAT